MNQQPVYLHKIATAVPLYAYTQSDALALMLRLIKDHPEQENIITKIYQNSAIEKRYSVLADFGLAPADFTFFPKNPQMRPEPGTKARNDLYITESNKLALNALRNLEGFLPDFDFQKVTHLITVSCTGMSAPGFDFFVSEAFPLSPTLHRFHLGFMGCFAAIPALKLAQAIASSQKDARILILNLELCSLHFQQSLEMDMIVGNAIFSDGASAALVSSDPFDAPGPKFILKNFESRIIPESRGDMAWKIGEHGFEMRLSAYVPRFIEKNMGGILLELFNKYGLEQKEIGLWAIHPGGRAILDRLAKSLQLTPKDLFHSYQILKNYGNMSSATILFVLASMLSDDSLKGPTLAAAFGPGLTVETGLLDKILC